MSDVRDKIRASVLKSRDVQRKQIEFFGETIELRQMRLEDVLQVAQEQDRESAIIDSLVKYAYVPGTDEKVFEESDAAAFKEMPFGADFLRVSNALEELSEVNFLDKKAT